jgi:hypothetical protein
LSSEGARGDPVRGEHLSVRGFSPMPRDAARPDDPGMSGGALHRNACIVTLDEQEIAREHRLQARRLAA